jgi:hypothetical protein
VCGSPIAILIRACANVDGESSPRGYSNQNLFSAVDAFASSSEGSAPGLLTISVACSTFSLNFSQSLASILHLGSGII